MLNILGPLDSESNKCYGVSTWKNQLQLCLPHSESLILQQGGVKCSPLGWPDHLLKTIFNSCVPGCKTLLSIVGKAKINKRSFLFLDEWAYVCESVL